MWTTTEHAEFSRLKNAFGRALYDLYWTEGVTDCQEPWLVAVSYNDEALVLHIARIGGVYVALDDELSRVAEERDLQAFINACIQHVRAPRQPTMANVVQLPLGRGTLELWAAFITELLRDEIAARSHTGENYVRASEPSADDTPFEVDPHRATPENADQTEIALIDRPTRVRQTQATSATEGRAAHAEQMLGLAFLQAVITVASIELAVSASRVEARTVDPDAQQADDMADLADEAQLAETDEQAQAEDGAETPTGLASDSDDEGKEVANEDGGFLARVVELAKAGVGIAKGLLEVDHEASLDLGKRPSASFDDDANDALCFSVSENLGSRGASSAHQDCESSYSPSDAGLDDQNDKASLNTPVEPIPSKNGVSVYLIDTVTDERVANITQSGTIDASLVESGRYSIEVVPEEETLGPIGSVALSVNGSKPRVENVFPYALFGDGEGNYYGMSTLSDGVKDLSITVYSETGGKGEATDLVFSFEVEGAPEVEAAELAPLSDTAAMELTENPIAFLDGPGAVDHADQEAPVSLPSTPEEAPANILADEIILNAPEVTDSLDLVTL